MKDLALIKNEFEKDGYVFIPGFLDEGEVSLMQKNFDRVIESVVPEMAERHVFYEDKGDKATLKQLIDLNTYDQYFNKVLNNGRFKDVAEFLLDDKVTGKTLEYFNKPPHIGKATPPHQDGYYFMLDPSVAITMWMALDPADEENGCVRYVRGSHKKGMRPHGRTTTLGFSQQITDFGIADDRENEICFFTRPGDLLIHHSLTVHHAGANTSSRPRKALGLIYFGESAKEDKVAKARYMQTLEAERLAQVT